MTLSFVAIDFETANYRRDSACSVGLTRVEDGAIVEKIHRLIDPQDYFLDDFIDIHGITPEMVADAPCFAEVWKELKSCLKGVDFIAAHNASFDRSVLTHCCQSYGIKPPTLPFVCTVKLARQIWNIYPTQLPNVCERLRIRLSHHNPMSDALACAKIVQKALSKNVNITSFYK